MSLYYVDTSAAIKLLAQEAHSGAFAKFYDDQAEGVWVSSALLRIELVRAVGRVLPSALPDARDLLDAFEFVAIDDDIVEAAMGEPDRMLRSLDAIHLATAMLWRESSSADLVFATHDTALGIAARSSGFRVVGLDRT